MLTVVWKHLAFNMMCSASFFNCKDAHKRCFMLRDELCSCYFFFLKKKKVFKTFWAINSLIKLLHISYQSKHIHLFPVNTHIHITHWPLDYIMFVNWNKWYTFQQWFQWLIFGVFTVKLTLDECRWTSLMPNYIASGNGPLTSGTKPLPGSMLAYSAQLTGPRTFADKKE